MNPRILAVSDVFKISAFVFLGRFCTALSVFMRVGWLLEVSALVLSVLPFFPVSEADRVRRRALWPFRVWGLGFRA